MPIINKNESHTFFPRLLLGMRVGCGKELSLIDDNIKTILVLAKVDDQNVAPFCIRAAKTENQEEASYA